MVFGYSAVSTVQAELPAETYYQGIDTGVNGDDVGSSALPIGFDFTFFGNTYTEFYVSSNGFISFESQALDEFTNDDITERQKPDNYIAPFWDDTTVYNGSDQFVYYKTIGTAPNRQLVVQYTNVGFWNDPTPLGTFSIILYEGSNDIQFQYRYLVGNSPKTVGASATIGLEDHNGGSGTKYSYNTESLASEQVIRFTPNGDNYDIGTAAYEGILLGAGAAPSPDIPVQTAPANGSTVSQTPTFSWSASDNADSYELRIDNNANMGSLTLNPTGITGTSFTPSAPLPEDTYYWIVIAHNADDSSWSEQWTFTTSSSPPPPQPDAPLLVSPAQTATDVSLTPTFSWQTAPNADAYQLLVSENADLSVPVIDQSGLTTSSFDASGLDSDTSYYWAVIASNTTGSTQSTVRNFTTLHVNTAPTANDDSESVDEDSGTTSFDVLDNDSDPDSGDTLSIDSVGATDNGGTAALNSNQIDYTPATNFFGTEVFTYTVSDGNGGSDTATVTVTVSSVNDTPIAIDDSEAVDEDSGTTAFDVLDNDSDPDTGDTLSIASVGAADNGGTAVINSNQIDYTPATNFFGTEVFTYTVNDGNGGSDTATVTVTVSAINDAPTANDDSETVAEDSSTTSFDVLGNDSDPDAGDTLSIDSVGGTDNGGTAVINSNQIDYTPATNFFGTEVFTYTVSDGNGGSDTATVTVTVNAVNDMPTANDDSETVAEDSGTTSFDVLANDSDPDASDILSIDSVGATDNGGTAVINSNQIDYTPDTNFFGTEVFTYTVSDGNGGSGTATVTVTVGAVNDAPTANDDSETVVENSSTIQIDLLDNDTDPDTGDTLTIFSVGTPDNGGTAVINGSLVDYTPAPDIVGTEAFTYTVSDGNGGSDTGQVTIEIQADTSNAPPQAQDDNPQTSEDSTIVIHVMNNDSDPNGDALSIVNIGSAAHGTAVMQGSSVRYTPDAHYYGTDSFTYTISDGEFTDSATVTITILPVNDLPQANLDITSTMAGATVIIQVLDNDVDPVEGSSLTVTAVENPAHGSATTDGTTITYTPDPGFVGTETFTYTLSDGTDAAVGTVTVNVNPYQVFIPTVIK